MEEYVGEYNFNIIPIYASILALIYAVLVLNVVRLRTKHRVSIGDGENSDLNRAIRAHGNFAENVPFALLLLFVLEINGSEAIWLHGLGALLCLGRLSHIGSVLYCERKFKTLNFRRVGVIATLTVIIVAALKNLAMIY